MFLESLLADEGEREGEGEGVVEGVKRCVHFFLFRIHTGTNARTNGHVDTQLRYSRTLHTGTPSAPGSRTRFWS